MLFLTHAHPRVLQTIAALASENIKAHDLSFQRIVQSKEQSDNCLEQARNINQFEHVVFVSPNAIDAFFHANLAADALQSPISFAAGQIIVVGPGSQAVLDLWLNQGRLQPIAGRSSEQARTFDADGVLEQLRTLHGLNTVQTSGISPKILVVKGTAGRLDWIEQARHGGLIVQELQAYTALDCSPSGDSTSALVDCMLHNCLPCLVMTSTANVSRLVSWALAQSELNGNVNANAKVIPNLLPWLQQQTILAIHPRIAAQLTALSFTCVKEILPGFEALRAAALKYGN